MPEITILKQPREEAVITQRMFLKKTARGKVIKGHFSLILRERYLQDDISCGINGCRACDTTAQTVLSHSGDTTHKDFPTGHYILPDTNVFLADKLNQIQLLHAPIIILHTVMEEVRHRSLPLYIRLKALTTTDERKVWVFNNEFRSETAIVREDDETPNDRNDRGIRKAAEWYNAHLPLAHPPTRGQPNVVLPKVVLITDDFANRRKADKEKIPCISVRNYVDRMKNSDHLLDLLSATGSDEVESTRAVAGRTALYADYLPISTLVVGVKAGQLHQGHFNANQYNYLESKCSMKENGKHRLTRLLTNFNSGSVSPDTFGHYGLASPIYTHFTRPIRRFADILVHRQLAAAIGYTPLHPSLHSKMHVERIMEVVNRCHRMAQVAGCAKREVTEDAFVIRTFRNGLGVFVSKLGLEGLAMFKRDTQFDAENYTISLPSSDIGRPDVTISVFDKGAQLLQRLSTGPQVCADRAVEALTRRDFRRKISGGANNAAEHCFSASDAYGSVEVDNRQAATVGGEEDIWRLQIQVCHTMLMHEVNSFEQLLGHRP
ncbi:hypothetical protein C8R48DRAFT_774721 [Suillus tomentosus]|nr:hypothetical protein C8R48DRAFT_774721 [Suillus tomentosus]